jgi:hypothetical protein
MVLLMLASSQRGGAVAGDGSTEVSMGRRNPLIEELSATEAHMAGAPLTSVCAARSPQYVGVVPILRKTSLGELGR